MTRGDTRRFVVDRDPLQVADTAERIAAFCRVRGCCDETAFRLQVGSAELLNNIYEHGAPQLPDAATPWVVASLRVRPGAVHLVVLEPPGPATTMPVAGLPDWTRETGRGLFILSQWFPLCRCRRWHGRTCWQLALAR